MKTIKAALLIILGSLFLATGFAFAGDSAYGSLAGGNPFGMQKGVVPTPSPAGPATGAVTTPAASNPAEVGTPAPTPPAGPGAQFKKWIGAHKTNIAAGAIGAYVGYALVGTMLGACTFGLGFLLVLALAAA